MLKAKLRITSLGLVLLLWWCAGCGPTPTQYPTATPASPPSVALMVNPNIKEVLPGESVALTADASGSNLRFQWSAGRGNLSDFDTPAVIYTAPEKPGVDTVTVVVSSDSGTATKNVSFNVIPLPTPVPSPTLTPTDTPEPTIPPRPSATPTPAPTPSPTPPPNVAVIDESGIYCTEAGGRGIATFALNPPRPVARIRVDMMARATVYGNSLWEVEAYGPDLSGPNLALKAAVRASSWEHDGNSPSMIVDGDPNTRWASEWYDPQWLEITFSAPQEVHWLVLDWEEAYAAQYCVRVLPQVYASNVQNRETLAQSFMLWGEYVPQVKDEIWILAGAPGENLWPQSPVSCEGQAAVKSDGRWQVGVNLGGEAGRLFEIVVATADEEAHRFISETVRAWCKRQDYPGFPRNELPAGLVEHQHIIVRKGETIWAPSPNLSTTDLPGEVTLKDVSDGDVVPSSFSVSGNYSDDVSGPIWVLVYAPDGHYYPQSTDACGGVATIQQDGLWEAKISLGNEGDAGKEFDILVILADPEANATFEARQENGCETGAYPGYLFIELPKGMDLKAKVNVKRE